jgi:hypothetical protein
MKFGPVAPRNLDLVRSKDAPPGYYFAPDCQLMIVRTPVGNRFIPMRGPSQFVEVPRLESTTLLRLKDFEVEVSFGEPVKYNPEQTWGAGHLVIAGSGMVSLAAFVRPSPQGEFERMSFDVKSCGYVIADDYAHERMWFREWEIIAVRDGVRSVLATSPPAGSAGGSVFTGER